MKGIPAHFGLPVAARYTDPPGYLGAAYDAFNIKGDPSSPELQFNKLTVASTRFEDRRSLLTQLDNLDQLSRTPMIGSLEAHDKFGEEAISLLTSGAMVRAMNLDEERAELRERYGMNVYGQRVLMARRLIEAGSSLRDRESCSARRIVRRRNDGRHLGQPPTVVRVDDVSRRVRRRISPSGYRWHSYRGPGNLPQLDMSLSTLLDDLDQRGLLDTTLVVVMGEFGRTPRINKDGGRDHYPGCRQRAVGRCGNSTGAVIGATDRTGAAPATRPWTPEDVAASIYHALGIDHHRTYFPRLPRPTPIADGQVIDGLFA